MPDSYSVRRGFDSRRTDSNFGIVQSAGHETLNLAIQVRALVPKPRRDTCVRSGTCVFRSLTMETQRDGARPSSATGLLRVGGGGVKTVSFFRGRHVAGRRGCYPLLIARSTRALGANPCRSFWEGLSFVKRCARFDSADRLQPWQAAQKKRSAVQGPFVFW